MGGASWHFYWLLRIEIVLIRRHFDKFFKSSIMFLRKVHGILLSSKDRNCINVISLILQPFILEISLLFSN